MHPLTQKIDDLRRRLLWRRRITAANWVLAAAIGAAVVLSLADYWIRFQDTGLRIMATSALALCIAWTAYRRWYLPSRVRLQTLDVARRVESQFPQLQDALASAIEFLDQSENDHLAGSAQLRRLVVAHAQNEVDALSLGDVVDRRPLRQAATALTTAAVAAAACLFYDVGATRIAIARLVAPLGPVQWPREHQLALRKVPTRLAAGDTLEVEIIDKVGQLPDDTRLEIAMVRDGGREVTHEPLVRAGDMFVARKENVQHSFGIRARGGDDDSMPWQWVEVVEPPRLESLELKVHPPQYSGLPVTVSERHLHVLAGSGIEVNGVTSKPIRAAQVLPQPGEPIVATATAASGRQPNHSFHISAEQWIANKTIAYRIELTDANGVTSTVGRWNLTVEPDPPPGVTWQQPMSAIHVLPPAAVPLAVHVKDNLAIRSVRLLYERSDRSESERRMQLTEPAIDLYQGPDHPLVHPHNPATNGESRLIEYTWDLASLALPPGATLIARVEAEDYRPGAGRTSNPLQVFIISRDQLESRLAERQSQIARQLESALAIQQSTREDVRRLEIEHRDLGGISQNGRATLQGAELNQRRVNRLLVDPGDGAASMARSILDELAMNRLENSPLQETMESLAAELRQLADTPLSTANRSLTDLRKTLEASPPAHTNDREPTAATAQLDAKTLGVITHALSATSAAQDEVITALDRLVAELSGKLDYRRIARLLAELRQTQIEHEQAARAEIGLETLSLQINELTRSQRASLNAAAAGEEAIATRFAKIEHSLEQLAQQLSKGHDSMSVAVENALELARQLSIGLGMRQATEDLKENRVGQALDRELAIAADLQKVIDVLRGETSRQPERLVDQLRAAGQKLDSLRRNASELRQQIANAERKPADVNEQRRLTSQQQTARQAIEKLSRELERLQATDASKSTRDAAQQLRDNEARKPSASAQVRQAEKSLEQAARQLAQQRQQAEDDLALEFVKRFQTELTEMVASQQRVLKQTKELNATRESAASLSAEQQKQIAELANVERQLANQAKEHGELLVGLEAVWLSLNDSERRLQAAGKLLDSQDIGIASQHAEQLALDRLEGMLQAFAQTASEATPKPNASPPNAAAANPPPPQPQRRPTFELLQAKTLRMLQADLNSRTEELQNRLTTAKPAEAAALRQEAQELAAEQGRLARLVESMLRRDNKVQPPP